MFADFDFSTLKPFLIVGALIIAALVKAFAKPKDGFDRPWETTGFPDESEGHKVIGRYPRPEEGRGVLPPLPSPPSTARPLTDWEREIERVLRGDPTPPVPPVVSRTVARPPLPPRPPIYADPAINESADIESAPAPTQVLATLAPAEDAYAVAATLDSRVAEHLREVDDRIAQAAPDHVRQRPGRSVEAEQVLGLLRRPQTARQAMLASVILSGPKALEA